MNLEDLFHSEFDRHEDAVIKTRADIAPLFPKWVEMCQRSLNLGGKIIFFGNGGSAADAQHLATELTVRYTKNRKAMAALSLATDTSSLTAIGNDFGFDEIFARQLEALCQPEDVCIAITTSGTSPNILKAVEAAQNIGAKIVGLTGRDGGQLKDMCDLSIIVPHPETARIQEMHITLGHALCQALENNCD